MAIYRNSHNGYTLLELMLSLSLLIVLLAILWQTVAVFTQSQHRGLRLAERSQLVRSLSQLLQDDLDAAIQDPIRPQREVPGADDDIRRFGLSGTSKSLRLDVVAMNPFAEYETAKDTSHTYHEPDTFFDSTLPDEPDSDPTPSDLAPQQPTQPPPTYAAMGDVSAGPPRAAELKTVFYEFNVRPPTQATGLANYGGAGLSRREIDFETPNINAMGITGSYMTAPEVVDCRFRYFDGANWSDSWESIERGGLPVAVEVTITLLPLSEALRLHQRVQTPLTTSGTAFAPMIGDPVLDDPVLDDPVIDDPVIDDPLFSMPEAESQQPTAAQINIAAIAGELGLSTPISQRIVAYLKASPIQKFEQYQRERPPTRRQRQGSNTASSPASQPSPPPPPQPAGPQKSWIRQ